ncbi:MAG: hypothetical protein IJV65_06625 [Kiritimatiellae bacterium]|nr:hypothetical protein [Kiritimatiellia bacterium]
MKVKDYSPDALDHIASEFLGKPDTLPAYRCVGDSKLSIDVPVMSAQKGGAE